MHSGAAETMSGSFPHIEAGERMYGREEVLSRPCPVPAEPGVYAWYFTTVPPGLNAEGCHRVAGRTLLYVGISPTRRGVEHPASRSTLRKRLRTHFRGNAEGSTLRRSIGCLLSGSLGIQLRRVGGGGRYTFTNPGERLLDEWLGANAFVVWRSVREPWLVEEGILRSGLPLPLNIRGNPCLEHADYLSGIRRAARLQATSLPVICDNGGARRVR